MKRILHFVLYAIIFLYWLPYSFAGTNLYCKPADATLTWLKDTKEGVAMMINQFKKEHKPYIFINNLLLFPGKELFRPSWEIHITDDYISMKRIYKNIPMFVDRTYILKNIKDKYDNHTNGYIGSIDRAITFVTYFNTYNIIVFSTHIQNDEGIVKIKSFIMECSKNKNYIYFNSSQT